MIQKCSIRVWCSHCSASPSCPPTAVRELPSHPGPPPLCPLSPAISLPPQTPKEVHTHTVVATTSWSSHSMCHHCIKVARITQQVCNVLFSHLSFLPLPVSSLFPLTAPYLPFHLSPLPSLSSPSPCWSIATSPTGSATSSGSKTHPGHGSHPTATAAAKELRTPPAAEIKSSLLQHAEDNILFVYRQQEEETAESQHGCRSSSLVIIKCYLAMVQVCLVQLMPSLAANCALAAMRVVQTHFEQGVGDTPTGWVGLHHGMHVCICGDCPSM